MIGLIKGELRGKIITDFVALRPKTYSHLMNDGNSDKEAEGAKKCVIKSKLKFNVYKKCSLKQ